MNLSGKDASAVNLNLMRFDFKGYNEMEAGNRISNVKWMVWTFMGWLLGVMLIIVLSAPLDNEGAKDLQLYVGIGMGTGVGFAQWMLLKKFSRISINWLFFSLAGMGGTFLLLELSLSETWSYKLPLCVAMGTIVTGLLQFSILKHESKIAFRWILSSFFGWMLAALPVFAIEYTLQLKALVDSNLILVLVNLLLIFSGGIILGAVTGFTIKRVIV